MPFAWNSSQKPNRYAVNNTIQAINRYTQSMPLVWNSPPKTNCYAVDGAMPLVRTWVITDYLFPLADLLYLPRDGIDSFYASCMIIFELVFFFLHIIFSPFHPFTFRFPVLPKSPTARWQLTKWLTPIAWLLRVDCYLEQAHYLAHQTPSPHLFASCH